MSNDERHVPLYLSDFGWLPIRSGDDEATVKTRAHEAFLIGDEDAFVPHLTAVEGLVSGRYLSCEFWPEGFNT